METKTDPVAEIDKSWHKAPRHPHCTLILELTDCDVEEQYETVTVSEKTNTLLVGLKDAPPKSDELKL